MTRRGSRRYTPRRPDLRRPRRGAARRRAGRCCCTASPSAATRWRAVAPLLHAAAGCARSPPTSAATRPAPGRAGAATTGSTGWSRDVEALVDAGRPAGAPGRPRLGRRASPGWLAARRPDLVRTLTAVSVPHPVAFLRAMADLRGRALRVLVHAASSSCPWLPELAGRPPGGRFDAGLRRGGHDRRGRRPLPPRDRRVRRAAGRARRGTARMPARPARAGAGAKVRGADDAACGATGTSRSAAQGAGRCAAWVDAGRTRLVVLEGVSALDPDPGARAAGRAIVLRPDRRRAGERA